MIEKKLPGCDPVHFVYDRSDRLILKQNGNNRKDGVWQYYQYDGLGREVIWGVLPSSAGREDWEVIFRDTVCCERFIGLGQDGNFGYTNTAAFNESRTPLIVSYYDSYAFEALSDSFLTYVDKPDFGKRIERPSGKLTGQIIALLNNPELKEHVTLYYDNRGRVIQTNACSVSGFHNYSFTKYDFIGQPISVRKEHYSIYPAKAILEPEATYDHTIVYDYEYDHAGRLTRLYQTFDKNERIKIAEYRYDEAGRLVGKVLHDGKFDCKYDYNIRGWLTEIDEPFMNEKIYYNEDLPEGVEPLYNGNIADVYYSAHDSAHFRLSYDGLNRLTASQQYTRDGVKTAAAEAFTYDKMGNITSIVRSTQNPQPDYINRVQLFYDGNRIIRGEGSPYSGGYNDMVYPNLVGKDVEYEYDPNGNLIKNEDNRISLTTYNLLNLPQTVAFSDKSLSVFYYMADGRKIRNATGAYSISTAVPIDSVIKNTDPYISYMSEWNDVYWYQRTQQKYINTPEGNIEVSTGRKMSFSYYYTSKDHLGSIWHYWNSLNNSRANIYYPSGIMREKRRSPYNYGLTGKEIVYDNGLDEYFFGARTLFAPINRFNQPDPLCEEYYHISPYAYCANNFINALDPDGRDWYIFNQNGIYQKKINAEGTNRIMVHSLKKTKTGEEYDSYTFINFADPINDARDIDNGIINRLVFVNEQNIQSMLAEQGAFDSNKLNFGIESQGNGNFDYSFTVLPQKYPEAHFNGIDSNSLFLPEGDNTAHNFMNFGNYLWGATGYTVGFGYTELQIGAHLNSKFNSKRNGYSSQWDSEDDQRSIIKGIYHAKSQNYRRLRK